MLGQPTGVWANAFAYETGALADANVYRFSSKEIHVNSGMYYYLYQFYDPNLQRTINRDPIAEEGGLNLYAVVFNSPLNGVDCFGLDGSDIVEIGKGACEAAKQMSEMWNDIRVRNGLLRELSDPQDPPPPKPKPPKPPPPPTVPPPGATSQPPVVIIWLPFGSPHLLPPVMTPKPVVTPKK